MIGWMMFSRDAVAKAEAALKSEELGVRDEVGFLSLHLLTNFGTSQAICACLRNCALRSWGNLYKHGQWLVPDGSSQVTHTFKAPFARAGREDDYRVAWAPFEAVQ